MMRTKGKLIACSLLVSGLLFLGALAHAFAAIPPTILDITFSDSCDGMHLVLSNGRVKKGSLHTAADCAMLQIPLKRGNIDEGTLTVIENADDLIEGDTWRWRIHSDHTYHIDYKNRALGAKEFQEMWGPGTWAGGDLPPEFSEP